MRRRRRRAPSALCLAAAVAPLAGASAQQPPEPGTAAAAALARFLERAPGLFRVRPDDEEASVRAIAPGVPRLPVRLTVLGADDASPDGRCALDGDAMRAGLEQGLAGSGLAPAADGDDPAAGGGAAAIELVVTASTEAYEGGRCFDLAAAEARLRHPIAAAGGVAFVFEPVVSTASAVLAHEPRGFPTAAFDRFAERVAGGIEAALDEGVADRSPAGDPADR